MIIVNVASSIEYTNVPSKLSFKETNIRRSLIGSWLIVHNTNQYAYSTMEC